MTRTQRDLCPGCTCTWPYGALVAHDSDCPFMEQFKSKPRVLEPNIDFGISNYSHEARHGKTTTTQRDHDSALLESYCGVASATDEPTSQSEAEFALPGEHSSSLYSPLAIAHARAEGLLRVTSTGLGFIRDLKPDQCAMNNSEFGLVTFFYLLMRDDIVPGKVASIVQEVEATPANEPIIFTNKRLEAYAREVVNRLKAK